ncbi:MAG: AAA family ATPase [Candidatus Levybacteria bacterium]|nr:AAA family ATPase [Candidatus Levybacteria bacterium]
MKIVKLTIHNFLKLKDVEMNPSKTNIIVGKNKQGKTSILKAIRAAFTGDADSTSIRIGEGKAEITVELDDAQHLNIKRTITEKGNYLDVSNKEGMKMPAPQKYLDGILGTFSFNPIEFFEKKQVDRKKYLLNAIKLTISQDELATYTGEKLTGLDYNEHALEVVEQARKFYYDKRTAANSEATKKEKALQDLTSKIPEGFDPKSVSEKQITDLRNAIQTDKLTKQKHEDHKKSIIALQKQEKDLTEQIAALKIKLIGVEDEILKAVEMKFDYSDDTTLVSAEETLAKLESQRDIVFTVKRAEEVRGELSAAIEDAGKLDIVVKKLTKEVPEDLIKKAKLPIEGLIIDGDDIKINGVSLDNLSSSEQLKFGLQIVRALNGEFKVICVDGIETLDKDSFEFFLKEVEDDDFQYFVTRVEGNGAHSIVVDDGEIKS